MTGRIEKIGDDYAILLSAEELRQHGIERMDDIEVSVKGHKIAVETAEEYRDRRFKEALHRTMETHHDVLKKLAE